MVKTVEKLSIDSASNTPAVDEDEKMKIKLKI
jgi:hypothetical protein